MERVVGKDNIMWCESSILNEPPWDPPGGAVMDRTWIFSLDFLALFAGHISGRYLHQVIY